MADAVETDSATLAQLNLDFHRTIAEAAANPYLTRFLGQIENALRRRTQTTYAHGDRAAAHDEHRAIIDAIAAGDGARAEDVARAHMRNARDVRIAQLLGARDVLDSPALPSHKFNKVNRFDPVRTGNVGDLHVM